MRYIINISICAIWQSTPCFIPAITLGAMAFLFFANTGNKVSGISLSLLTFLYRFASGSEAFPLLRAARPVHYKSLGSSKNERTGTMKYLDLAQIFSAHEANHPRYHLDGLITFSDFGPFENPSIHNSTAPTRSAAITKPSCPTASVSPSLVHA